MKNTDDKILRMDQSRRFNETGAPRQPIVDLNVANRMIKQGFDSDFIRQVLGYPPDPEQEPPDQATPDIIAQVLPWLDQPSKPGVGTRPRHFRASAT